MIIQIDFSSTTNAGEPVLIATRHWYHVPRVGELVYLGDQGTWRVEAVAWRDDQTVELSVS